jgi:hypothetical protein
MKAIEGFRRFQQILNGPGSLEQRLLQAFTWIIPIPAPTYPTRALHQDFLRLHAEATRDPSRNGTLRATIGKMDDAERESMRQSLLSLARRVMSA